MNKLKKATIIALLSTIIFPIAGFSYPNSQSESRQLEIIRETNSLAKDTTSNNRILCEPFGYTAPDIKEQKVETKEEPIGVKYANQDIIAYTGPNIFESELRTIPKDESISFYEIMVNGWIRILDGETPGYIDGAFLRDTEKIIEEKVEVKKENVKKEEKAKTNNDKPTTNKKITFKLSFYTNIPGENGKYSTTASGKSPAYGMVASNTYSFGTRIYLEGYGEMVVEDRGGSHFNSSNRLDVFIPRKEGESNAEYKARAMKLGRQTVTGYIME